jgi:predicted phosphodiesterase
MKILVVGDIHGRTFWKSPVERYINKVDKIVFLGDYFDPYPNDDGECPSFSFMMSNFNEILDLKKANPDKVVLLYGNHDYHYASKKFDDMARSTRFNNFKSYELRQTFNENSDLFQLCYIADNENKKVVFTHAGITKFWLDLLHDTDYIDDDVYNSIYEDCHELLKLLTSIIKSSKNNLK